MKRMVIGSVVVLSLFLVGAGPPFSAILATASASAALAPGSGMLMFLGAALLGASRWSRCERGGRRCLTGL